MNRRDALSLLAASPLAAQPAAKHTFAIQGDRFVLDGKPFVIRSGEMHYARIPRDMIDVGLIAREMSVGLPDELAARLDQQVKNAEEDVAGFLILLLQISLSRFNQRRFAGAVAQVTERFGAAFSGTHFQTHEADFLAQLLVGMGRLAGHILHRLIQPKS